MAWKRRTHSSPERIISHMARGCPCRQTQTKTPVTAKSANIFLRDSGPAARHRSTHVTTSRRVLASPSVVSRLSVSVHAKSSLGPSSLSDSSSDSSLAATGTGTSELPAAGVKFAAGAAEAVDSAGTAPSGPGTADDTPALAPLPEGMDSRVATLELAGMV